MIGPMLGGMLLAFFIYAFFVATRESREDARKSKEAAYKCTLAYREEQAREAALNAFLSFQAQGMLEQYKEPIRKVELQRLEQMEQPTMWRYDSKMGGYRLASTDREEILRVAKTTNARIYY